MGDETFTDQEEQYSREFLWKEVKMINDGQGIFFNGGNIKMNHHTFKLTKSVHVEKL